MERASDVAKKIVCITYDGKLTGSQELRDDNKFRIYELLKKIPPQYKSKIGEYAYLYDSAGKMGEPYFDAFVIMIAFLKDDLFNNEFAYYKTKFSDTELDFSTQAADPDVPWKDSMLKTDLVDDTPLLRDGLGVVYSTATHIFLMGPASESCLLNITRIIQENENVIIHIQGEANPSDPSKHTNTVSAPFMTSKEGMFPVAFNLWTGETIMYKIRTLCTDSYTVGLRDTAAKFTYFRTPEEESRPADDKPYYISAYNEMKTYDLPAFNAGVAANIFAKNMQEFRAELYKSANNVMDVKSIHDTLFKKAEQASTGEPTVEGVLPGPFNAYIAEKWKEPCIIKPPYSEIINAMAETNPNWKDEYKPIISIPVIPLVFDIGLDYIVKFILAKCTEPEQKSIRDQHTLHSLCDGIKVELICQDTFDKDNSVSLALASLLTKKTLNIDILARRVYNRANQIPLFASSPFKIVLDTLMEYSKITANPDLVPEPTSEPASEEVQKLQRSLIGAPLSATDLVKYVRCCDNKEWQSPISILDFTGKLPQLSTNYSFNRDKTLASHNLSKVNMGEMLTDSTDIPFNIMDTEEGASISDGVEEYALDRRCPFPESMVPAISWWCNELSEANFPKLESLTSSGGKRLKRTRKRTRKYNVKRRKSNKYNV